MSREQVTTPICAIIAVALLFCFGRDVWKSSIDQTGPSGITVRSEVLTIFAPKALIEFAKAHPEITTNDELVRLVGEAKLSVWFATVARNHQANGIYADLSTSYRLGERPECFDTTKAVLRALAGNRPHSETVSYANARIEVIEEAMMEMAPVEGLRQLLTH
jgi:hypothetical protein